MIMNGDETNRSNLILDSQDRSDLKGAIYCIALAKNSPFYSQKGIYKEMTDAKAFGAELYRQVFLIPRSESGCYIPQSIREEIPNLTVKASEMVDKIHQHLFNGKTELTVEERKLFIEIYYDTLTKYIITGLGVDSFNISCKDAIDRGAGSNAQLFANSAIINSPEGKISPVMQKKTEMLMMVRAFLVRKRPPLLERVERFADGLDHAFSKVNELKALHLDVFGKLQIVPV
jgi:hypothetical protein